MFLFYMNVGEMHNVGPHVRYMLIETEPAG